jgi:hypothetical protein
MVLHFGDLRQQRSQTIVVLPGEKKIIHEVRPFTPTSETVIVAMGVTQHPGTVYTYNSDGRVLGPSPYPLGEFHKPIWTCRDMGQWLSIGEVLTIHVENQDTEAHMYASLLLTFDRTKEA